MDISVSTAITVALEYRSRFPWEECSRYNRKIIMNNIDVFIVDDNFIARRGLRSVLEAEDGYM